MHRPILTAVAALLAMSGVALAQSGKTGDGPQLAEAGNVPWRTNVKQAFAEAKQAGKPLMIYFYLPG